MKTLGLKSWWISPDKNLHVRISRQAFAMKSWHAMPSCWQNSPPHFPCQTSNPEMNIQRKRFLWFKLLSNRVWNTHASIVINLQSCERDWFDCFFSKKEVCQKTMKNSSNPNPNIPTNIHSELILSWSLANADLIGSNHWKKMLASANYSMLEKKH